MINLLTMMMLVITQAMFVCDTDGRGDCKSGGGSGGGGWGNSGHHDGGRVGLRELW